ncbi:hypothetical protein [Bradyrhizobium sp. STM 3809]|nr:hypothetical protein [Bradyrhizobium sp. STM 3809]
MQFARGMAASCAPLLTLRNLATMSGTTAALKQVDDRETADSH